MQHVRLDKTLNFPVTYRRSLVAKGKRFRVIGTRDGHLILQTPEGIQVMDYDLV